MRLPLRLFACFVAALTVTPSFGQESRFCLGGDLDHLSKAELQACRSTLEQVRSASIRFHGPAQWHYIVVCDESSWTDLAAFSNRNAAELARVSVDSDVDTHLTFFRAAHLTEDQSVQRIVAQEIASIQGHTTSGQTAERQAELSLPAKNDGTDKAQGSL